nr:hypothetical protein [Candidatus Sigynarchaeota archaeon]
MARLTKKQSEAKKARIAELLASNTPWAQIVKETGCSNQTIAAIHNGSGNRSGKKSIQATLDPASQAENAALKAGVSELYKTFLAIAEKPQDARYILEKINAEKIDGAVKYL